VHSGPGKISPGGIGRAFSQIGSPGAADRNRFFDSGDMRRFIDTPL
jgi:hypothetical protein